MELEKNDIDKLQAYAERKQLDPVTMAMRFTQMYNQMDRRCQQLARTNPKRPITDYCERCQSIFKRVLL